MFPVFYSICRQTSIFKTEMCTLYWYLLSRTTNPWCYWHTKTVETWNCEAEVNPYVLWERLEVTWHSCIPTTAVVQAFSLFPIFEDRSPFLPSVFFPLLAISWHFKDKLKPCLEEECYVTDRHAGTKQYLLQLKPFTNSFWLPFQSLPLCKKYLI